MFTRLKKQIEKENNQKLKDDKKYVAEQLKEKDPLASWYCLEHLTSGQAKKIKSGEMKKSEVKKIIYAKLEKEAEKNKASDLATLEKLEQVGDGWSGRVVVEWHKSRVWGYNPVATVEMWNGKEYHKETGTASGCGYDKRGTAISIALNKLAGLRKALAQAEEKRLGKKDKPSRYDFIGYGTTTSALPEFDRGCGDIYKKIFAAMGYEWTQVCGSGWLYNCDVYTFAPLKK